MDYVLLLLALPLAGLAIYAVARWRRLPPAAGDQATAFATARPVPGVPPQPAALAWLGPRVVPWLLVLAVVVGVILLFNRVEGGANVLRLVMLCRYGLLAGLLLVGLVSLALLGAPSLLGNLFVLRKPWQLFNVAWVAVLVASMAVV